MTPPLSTSEQAVRAERFLVLHRPGAPLLMPNAWDVGSARLFASIGMEAIATTSGGFAASRGRLDGAMSGEEVLEHCGDLAGAVDIPVSGDLENCLAQDADGVADFIAAAKQRGLAGGSIEDFTRHADEPIYELGEAAERVRAAADAAHAGPIHFVLTARAENYLHGRVNLGDTITRLQAYQEAGADVLFAPRVVEPAELRQLLAEVDIPVSVLVTPKAPPIHELAELGVSRISVGGAIAAASYGFAVAAVKQLRDEGTPDYWDAAAAVRDDMTAAFVKP
ncbi:MAG TPA: isocitrate lyase/phosphoenolpyruvate mutase family protein [Acidimicrobiales bacterium]|nr:isocitrate lyase/phosphoenolpyruvate mutase family protein [Acidimicrobiales bacterium]